ncbi:glycerophosphodiester phosphodiesterase family protein [Pseudoroseicyclus aestuarii]|uniref:Glycerophosphoryl diester phosphodiesterase n=1 Tax=Pseudoroseicyclus aestuarii TaxID=1795041 RepID=A0A318STK4_9RHOB|nr:glycerophosphodiester phosphodiesterase family protein [Pseudoroseicyclus aestuarii]PYE83709.1 glycerophosphoryl diester phosphodiesterase [Pseudoroseicyclus aestuarii]
MQAPALPEGFLTRPVAHRALHGPGLPENSLAAARAAVAGGYGIEIDLQPSSDGVPMVFHDETLDRITASSGPVSARSAEALQALTLKGGEEGIPTLAQMLEVVAGRVPLLVEIKDRDGALGPDIGPLEEAAAKVLAGYDGPLAVMSFNPHSVLRMAQLLPGTPRGITSCAYTGDYWQGIPQDRLEGLRAISGYAPAGCSFVSHEWRDLASPRIAALREAGAAILCWTLRDAADDAEARTIADNVTFEGYAA